MKTRVLRSIKEEDRKMIHNKSISTINKRCNLTQSRRQKIDFFVHKSIRNEIRFGSIRSTTWLTFLAKFINTPGVDGKVLLNWLDRIPCLRKENLYGEEFNRTFSLNNDLSFPSKWNSELEKAFEDENITPTSVHQDESDNTVNETQAMETAADVNGTVNEMEEEPATNSSKIKPIILRRVEEDPSKIIPEDAQSTNSFTSTENIAPYIIFAPKKVENIDHGCGDIRATVSPGVEFLGNAVLTDETMKSDCETTTEVRQDSKETTEDIIINVEDDVLNTPVENLLIPRGGSEEGSFYLNTFDESLLQVDSTSQSQGPSAENGLCETRAKTPQQPPNSVYNELHDSAQQNGHPIIHQMKAETSTSAESSGQSRYPYQSTQSITQRRLYFHKLRALCTPRDIETFSAIVDLENRINDISTLLQNISYYVGYSVENLQHIYSSMEAIYAPVHKPM